MAKTIFNSALTHVHGNIDGWIAGAADAIQKRAGGTSAASQYVMTLDKNANGIYVKSFALVSGNLPLEQTSAGEAIVKCDWSAISGADQNTGPVAQAMGFPSPERLRRKLQRARLAGDGHGERPGHHLRQIVARHA